MITGDLRKVNGGGTALASAPCDPERVERQISNPGGSSHLFG
jgi:hypothetical protein